MKKVFLTLVTLAILSLAVFDLQAQQFRTPAPSPGATVMQTVGLTDVNIEYSRPSAKGRAVFAADGLVPFGQIWRTGANSATKITFSEDVKLGGQDVKKGSYAVLTVPAASEWKVNLYPYESSNFGSYTEKTPAVSVMVKAESLPAMVETFTIMVNNLQNDGATIDIMWEKTKVSIPVAVHTQKQVMASFETMMNGPSNAQYFAMGQYLHESGGDLNKALEYVRKATSGDNPAFWQVYREALILGDLGKKEEAIMAANKSMELAKKANNNDYVRLNENAIAGWKAKNK